MGTQIDWTEFSIGSKVEGSHCSLAKYCPENGADWSLGERIGSDGFVSVED